MIKRGSNFNVFYRSYFPLSEKTSAVCMQFQINVLRLLLKFKLTIVTALSSDGFEGMKNNGCIDGL